MRIFRRKCVMLASFASLALLIACASVVKMSTFDETFAVASCNPAATTISTAVCMQDINDSVISSMVLETQYTLVDSRDNNSYSVARLRDGHVWMTQNLSFDLSNFKSLTSDTTDLLDHSLTGVYENGYTYDSGTGITTWTPAATATTITFTDTIVDGWNISQTEPASARKTDQTQYGSLGNYYNRAAVVASNNFSGLSDSTEDDVSKNPQNSICPKGWRLPTTSSQSGSVAGSTNEFDRLNYLYNDGSSTSDGGLIESPLLFVRSGVINYNSGHAYVGQLGLEGNIWSSTVSESGGAEFIRFSNAGGGDYNFVRTGRDWGTGGRSARCVARTGISPAPASYTYTLNFDANANGDTVSNMPQTQTYGPTTDTTHAFTIPSNVPTREGYRFLYWVENVNSTSTLAPGDQTPILKSNKTMTLYAMWEAVPTYTYTLNFDANANGDTVSNMPQTQTYGPTTDTTHAFTIPSNVPTREGYRFLYWVENVNSTSTLAPGDQTPILKSNKTMTLYAMWEAVPTYTYTLNFDANANGDTVSNMPQTQTYGPTTDTTHAFVVPNTKPTRVGYEFAGWYLPTAPEHIYNVNSSVVVGYESPGLTLYAKWSENAAIEYEILSMSSDKYEIDSGTALVIRGNGDLNKFTGLKIDNVTVPEDKYSLTSGSTVVTISPNYLNTLTTGNHVATLVWMDGEVSTDFAVVVPESDNPTNPDNPGTPSGPNANDGKDDDYLSVPNTSAGAPDTGENTGDNIGGNIAVMILPIVLAGLATLAYKRNINKTHRKFD